MKRKFFNGLMLLMVLFPVLPQALAPGDALTRVLSAANLKSEWFTSQFLAAVSLEQLTTVIQQIKGQLGPFQRVEGSNTPYLAIFERGTATTDIALDSQGRISGLRFTRLSPRVVSLDQAVEEFKKLPGKVSVLVMKNGKEQASLNPDVVLAVGSAFKLVVLAALKREVAAGALRWDQVKKLEDSWKSLPSGILQNWPGGSPLTLHTLASLAISLSDNTAADSLIHIIGREKIEVLAPGNVPFLTTRELSVLKDPANKDLLDLYLKGKIKERRTVLEQTGSRSLPNPALFTGSPVAPQVEWFFSARQLYGYMAEVRELPLMGINPGLANPADWKQVAFKGGSEPGVLNLTTWLTSANGTAYFVAATQNRDDAPLEEATLFTLYSGLIEALKQ